MEDVRLDHAIPHTAIEWHETRRLKTLSSRRLVPLINAEALSAARQALESTAKGNSVFPAYFREGSADSASAALGKHVRACVTNPKLVTYSLRQLVSDLISLAGVSSADKDLVLGHTKGQTSEIYGSEGARLQRAKAALTKAFNVQEDEPETTR